MKRLCDRVDYAIWLVTARHPGTCTCAECRPAPAATDLLVEAHA